MKSADLEGLVRASSMAVLSLRTMLMSQVAVYLGCGGLEFAISAIRRLMTGSCPMLTSSTLT